MKRSLWRVGPLFVATSLALLASHPVAADVRTALGDFKAGRYLEAAAELQAIVDRSPAYAYAYFLLGHCMLKMSRPGEAEEQFSRAVALDPARPEYFQGLAVALKTGANWERSIQSASAGLSRAPDPSARYALLVIRGYAYGAVDRWGAAVRDLEAARKIRPEPWLSVLLGKAYFALGDYGRAIAPLRDALEDLRDDPDVLRLLSESFLIRAGAEPDSARKRVLYSDALGYARRLASVRPGDMDAVHLVGRGALGAGELLQAEAVFLHVLLHEPRQCYAMVNLGRTYVALARWTEAEAFLRKAAACAPRMGVVFETLGDLYMRRGLPQQAADAYRRAEEIDAMGQGSRVPLSVPAPPAIRVRNPRNGDSNRIRGTTLIRLLSPFLLE